MSIHGVSGKDAGIVGLLISLVAIALAVVAMASGSSTGSSHTALGTWKNMPSALTELMENTSYRGILETGSATGESGIFAALSVSCINPSNTIGAILRLQYANYSRTTQLNTSNFANIASAQVLIDNSASNPCPGNLVSGSGVLPSINANPADFILRVIGSGGGGTGDNPRFSSISALLFQLGRKIPLVVIGSSSTISFTYQVQEPFPVSVSTIVTIKWQATNITSSGCGVSGSSTMHCWEAGTSTATINAGATASSTITVTFTTAFTGTVQAVASGTGAGGAVTIPTGTISLLQAQTLTV